jgi:putative membrane protein
VLAHDYTMGELLLLGLHWVVSGLALLLTSYIVPGFRIKDFGTALLAAIVIGLINMLIRPFLMFIAFPINLLTLGLFTFVVDGVVLKMAAYLLRGFELKSWFAAVLSAFLLAVIGGFLHLVIY